MAKDVKPFITIGLIVLVLVLVGVVGFLISQPPRQINLTLTETLRKTLTLRSVDTVTITRTITVTEFAPPTKKEPAPPRIVNLSWEPARIVNDKIYDIRVRFLVIGDRDPIVSAKLVFKPEDYRYFITRYGMRPQDYEIVFLNDTRTIDLYPVDGVFDSTIEEFTTTIQNITGGVEYKIKVMVKDSSGREATTEIKTPYIRQYENLGKLLYEKGVIIAANYYPLYPDPHPWEALEPMAVHHLLGKYDVRDPIVIARKIDMGTGHGVNCFDIAWHFDWVIDKPHVLQKIKENIEAFLQNPLSSQIYFFLDYDPSGIEGRRPDGIWELKNSTQWKRVLDDIKFLNSWGIFDNPRYLKIYGKPVMYFYEAQAMIGEVDEMLRDVDNVRDILWIGDLVYTLSEPDNETIQQKKMLSYEGWSDWVGSWYIPLEDPVNYNFVIALERAHRIWGGGSSKIWNIVCTYCDAWIRKPKKPNVPSSS